MSVKKLLAIFMIVAAVYGPAIYCAHGPSLKRPIFTYFGKDGDTQLKLIQDAHEKKYNKFKDHEFHPTKTLLGLPSTYKGEPIMYNFKLKEKDDYMGGDTLIGYEKPTLQGTGAFDSFANFFGKTVKKEKYEIIKQHLDEIIEQKTKDRLKSLSIKKESKKQPYPKKIQNNNDQIKQTDTERRRGKINSLKERVELKEAEKMISINQSIEELDIPLNEKPKEIPRVTKSGIKETKVVKNKEDQIENMTDEDLAALDGKEAKVKVEEIKNALKKINFNSRNKNNIVYENNNAIFTEKIAEGNAANVGVKRIQRLIETPAGKHAILITNIQKTLDESLKSNYIEKYIEKGKETKNPSDLIDAYKLTLAVDILKRTDNHGKLELSIIGEQQENIRNVLLEIRNHSKTDSKYKKQIDTLLDRKLVDKTISEAKSFASRHPKMVGIAATVAVIAVGLLLGNLLGDA